MEIYIFLIAIFFFGNIIGSFFNVCIYRIPIGESIIFPGSHCPNCGYKIKWYDNIPIISYFILLKGKCRGCAKPISLRYPLIEILTGILFAIVFYRYLLSIETLKYLIFTSFLIILTFIDFKHYILPDILTIPLMVIGWIFGLFSDITLIESFIGTIVYMLPFLLICVLGKIIMKKDVMGVGDIKLGAAIGAFLGYTFFLNTYIFFMLSFTLGSIVGVTLIGLKIKSRKEVIPFGPYIAMSAYIMMVFGDRIVSLFLIK